MEHPSESSLQSQLDARRANSPAELTAAVDAQIAGLVANAVLASSLKVGDHAPDFTLPDALGHPVALADALAKGPVALTFYRGEWCPYCNLQLNAYQATLPQITALGATLIAVSPQTPDHSLSMAEKHALSFAVLSDKGNLVAHTFGIVFQYDRASRAYFAGRGLELANFNGDASWELPVPATFIIAPDGTVRFAFVDPDFRHRLEPADLLDELRKVHEGTK